MGKLVATQIRDNYPLYSDLLQNRKSIKEKIIDISDRSKNINFLKNDKVFAKHIILPHEIVFISEVRVRNYKSFKFKVRCTTLCEEPFFRYDSDGPPHRNYDEAIPLKEQQITTPHFHNFSKQGVSMAYHTNELKNDSTKKALEDISLCVVHFCNEGNIRVGKDDFPSITILSKTLGLTFIENDPNAGVNFI